MSIKFYPTILNVSLYIQRRKVWPLLVNGVTTPSRLQLYRCLFFIEPRTKMTSNFGQLKSLLFIQIFVCLEDELKLRLRRI